MDIKHVAQLANLSLTPEEETLFSSQLNQVVTYISALQKIDLTGIEPTSQSIDLRNVSRPDTSPQPGLELAHHTFTVPAIFAND